MTFRAYSTEKGRIVPFEPNDPGKVTMYICGPTVYDLIHIGHARSYVVFDVLRRWLEYLGYETIHVQNFTDVEDSVTRRAQSTGTTTEAVARKYTKAFFQDADSLSLRRAHFYPTVSENVGRMIEVTKDLLEMGHAYERDGNVFFRTRGSQDFGRLSHVDPEEAFVNGVEANDNRENPLDFVLWRKAKEDEQSWDSPWGEGRPGWHVSCYVMSTNHFEGPFDIHGGGLDLIFPHHESVMLISEAHANQPLCSEFVHNSFVTLGSRKMSKSEGHFITVRQLSERYGGAALRLYILKNHYRSLLDYDEEEVKVASEQLRDMMSRIEMIASHKGSERPSSVDVDNRIGETRSLIKKAMNNDLQTNDAVEAVENLILWSSQILASISLEDASRILDAISDFDRVLAIFGDSIGNG